ncbi:MAG: phosphoribosylpyrophosphate synthetase [Candidatus Portnoybacteria bacterium RBG_13_41_18]|uniref:Ribose-phosphate pyrophosphokinase n=1 Tax=Candidatus Portnoybacteria bacterium RBG_13_41_18 TaxID=1801991 RepID=A0A1G2F6S9_9BACT|nr:MAG: phosphoribosylpyrophosphate synthetase [Candidatus Portnoybacteria bacterium RBG_13_41_18]
MNKRKRINLNGELLIFSGNANPKLAQATCEYLQCQIGKAKIGAFENGEVQVEIYDDVRGSDIFAVQSICRSADGGLSINDNLMELLVLIDALKRSSARRITAVMPIYGYARQDRKVIPRAPISAKLVADLITAAGANRVLCIDLHAGQIQGFFNIPVDNIFARPVLTAYLKKKFKNLVVVSPDAGGVERARAYAKSINASLAIIDKRRIKPNDPASITMNILGDVEGLIAILFDDIVDTAGTLIEAAKALISKGAKSVYAACIHAVLSGNAIENIQNSPIKKLIVTDTIPLSLKATACPKIEVVSISELLSKAVKKIHNDESVSSLFTA